MDMKNQESSVSLVSNVHSNEFDDINETNIREYKQTIQVDDNSTLIQNNMLDKFEKYKLAFKNRSFIVDFLSIVFGIGSWIGINSTFLQLPLLVENAPEGWSLPSYLVVMIQLGNIGPLTYTIIQKFSSNKIKDSYMIYTVLLIGTIASLLIAFLYQKTAIIGGYEYSLSLFVLVFFLALIGCTSSVLFMPYMGRFKEIYLITYLIGEGLSGFLPSIVALSQGVGGNAECILTNSTEGYLEYKRYIPPPRFTTKEFYFFVFSITVCSTIAFFLLDKLKICKKEYAAVKISYGNKYVYENNERTETRTTAQQENFGKLTSKNYKILLILMAFVCILGNGIFPSVQSYSCLPYGNVAYHLTVSLSSMANPIACFLAVFLPHTSLKAILSLIGLTTVISMYTMATAILSPNPPLVGSVLGECLVVICWTILVGLVSYIKLCITTVMRSQGGKSLVWIGAVAQAGSAIGSIFIFVLVNYTHLFVSYSPC